MTRLTLQAALALLSSTSFGYYSPEVGRWVSRDPIGEWGGDNVYVSIENSSVNDIDALGESGQRGPFPHPTPSPSVEPSRPPFYQGQSVPTPRPPTPENPVGAPSTCAGALCGALDLIVNLMLPSRPDAVRAGYKRCLAEESPALMTPKCKCCVIDLRNRGGDWYRWWELVSAWVVPKPCAQARDQAFRQSVWRPSLGHWIEYEYEFFDW